MNGKLFYKNSNGYSAEYGIIGKPTCLTYESGETAHVGDIVRIIHSHYKKESEYAFICDNEKDKSFVMGLASISSNNVILGKIDKDFRIELVRKYSTLRNNEQYRSVIAKITEEDKKMNKIKEITTTIKADLLFDKPVVEEDRDEVYIYSGRTTVYINLSLGTYGVATVNSNELKSYNKEIGQSLAFKRSFDRLDKGE